MTEKEYITFKRLYWEWFDALPEHEKERFWYYKEDMSETFFFFKHYEKSS